MKPRILFILHLPLPIYCAAMMEKYLQGGKLINVSFDCYYINLIKQFVYRYLYQISYYVIRSYNAKTKLVNKIKPHDF